MPTAETAATAAAVFVALYASHTLGDHVVQHHRDADAKAAPRPGQLAAGAHPFTGWGSCLRHVASYSATQAVALLFVVDEDDAPGLIDTLILLNQAGYVTCSSQAGYDGEGYDGAHWTQLAAVTGFATPDTYAWLCQALTGTRFGILAWPCKAKPWHRAGRGIAVTACEGRTVTTFGTQLGYQSIAGELYDGVGDEAIEALCAALQVTIYDPEPGPNDLWPVLAEAAAWRLRHADLTQGG